MDRLSIDSIVSQGKIPESVARALLDGVSQGKLEELLVESYKLVPGSSQVSITRMNTIGGLRAMGYEVTGGRKGRGQPYQIVGWAEKQYPPTADQWTGDARKVLDTLETFEPVTYDALVEPLSRRPHDYMIHENSPGYILSYELARDTGYLKDGLLIVKKHPNVPKFRVFVLDARPRDVLEVVRWLSRASLQTVHVLNVDPNDRTEYRRLVRGSWGKREEAFYDCEAIAHDPSQFLNSRGMSQLRKNQRNTRLVESMSRKDEEYVVSLWKKHLEDRHRQLAISRDYTAIRLDEKVLHFVGYRDNLPVAAYVVDRFPHRNDTVGDMLNKAANYRFMPGGQAGTSDWLLVEVSKALSERGIRYLHAGGTTGGGDGLRDHKIRFAKNNLVTSYAFYPEIPHLTREELMS